MATIGRKRRLVNPGRHRKHKRMSLKQKLHFGTARQRAAAKASLGGHRRRRKATSNPSRRRRTVTRRVTKQRRRRARSPMSNIGEVITIGLNPGRVKGMARHRRRRAVSSHRRRRTYRHNPARRRRRLSLAPVHHRRRRSRNPRHYARRRHHVRRHRNPGMLGTQLTNVLGVLGGAAATKIVSGMLPASINTGIVGYISGITVAMVLGWGTKKFGKSPHLGEMVTIGGLTYVGLKIIQDFFPTLGAYSPFGVSGMGIISPSNFYVPQVNAPGSMGRFITPAGVTSAIPVASAAGARGMGLARRHGRLM